LEIKNKSKITQIEICRLTLKHFTACGHKIWVREEACSHALADVTYKYPSCYSSPVTSRSFVEPLTEAVVETVILARETCRQEGGEYALRPQRIGGRV